MSDNCQMVVFSNRAYNAIIGETRRKNPIETGGILLGHVLDNGCWIVMEVLPPGKNSVFEYAYFEYDTEFVNYLSQSVSNQYKIPLELLGLWHRHPGSMDVFSGTDDGTNTTFAGLRQEGTISALVNVDPVFRMTMYHLDNPCVNPFRGRPPYSVVDIEVGDDIIPEKYFELKDVSGEDCDLNPRIEKARDYQPSTVVNTQPTNDRNNGQRQIGRTTQQPAQSHGLDIQGIISEQLNDASGHQEPPHYNTSILSGYVVQAKQYVKKKLAWILVILISILAIFFIGKSCVTEAALKAIQESEHNTETSTKEEPKTNNEGSIQKSKVEPAQESEQSEEEQEEKQQEEEQHD